MTAAHKFRDNVVAFTALPNSVRLVLLLVFLNSFRSFGLRFVQQLYLTNEFGLDDLEAASPVSYTHLTLPTTPYV